MERPRYVLILEPLPSKDGEPEPVLRLRRLLKLALRVCRLKCVSAEEIKSPLDSNTGEIGLNSRGFSK